MLKKLKTEGAKQVAPIVATALALGAAAMLATSSPAAATGFNADVGSSERINLSGQLGTLSERILAAACNLDAGIATIESNAVLKISTHHFSRIHDALMYGNRGFGILGEEQRPRTLQAINALNAHWVPLQQDANATESGAANLSHVASLALQSGPLQAEAKVLVSEITGQYADPVALLRADAMLIEIAGRQRMLAQRMSKDVCLLASGVDDDQARTELTESIQLFEISLDALQNGLESVGVRPPPTAKIAGGLDIVADEWGQISPLVEAQLAGATLDEGAREQLFFAFLGLEARINNVVNMYDDNSKLNL